MSEDRNQRTPVSEEYLRASTLGELTALAAPTLLVDYDPQWPHRFQEAAKRIRTVLGTKALRDEHVGSKPIFSLRVIRGCRYSAGEVMKPKIYKIGPTWILWVPGVRVYRFTSWGRAMQYALEPEARQK